MQAMNLRHVHRVHVRAMRRVVCIASGRLSGAHFPCSRPFRNFADRQPVDPFVTWRPSIVNRGRIGHFFQTGTPALIASGAMASPKSTVNARLADAAFGAHPQLWPLPPATTPRERWQRAVAAGGQGRYACALHELDQIIRAGASGSALSLAHSTRASFLRQLGGHDLARGWDGRAWVVADDPEAGVDALVGLAADALGVGRLAASARLLARARGVLDSAAPPRLPVRLGWVAAELAMAGGDGAAAVEHAERAVEAADTLGSARHTVKSQVVLSAALCCAGRLDAAREVADAAFAETDRFGLIPLRWALGCLLADIGSTSHSASQVVAIRDAAADTVRRGGGVWSRR